MIGFDTEGSSVVLVADQADAAALTALSGEFAELLADAEHWLKAGSTAAEPAIRRLFPDPMPDDPSESAEIRELIAPRLVDHKAENARRVAQTLAAPGALSPRDETAWLQWLTDMRLVLAARLGIQLDGDEGASETARDRAMQQTYLALGHLQSLLLDAIQDRAGAPA